jgi:hypothetical protein
VKRIRTEYFIPFPPSAVWAVLADFGAYAQWNPLNIKAEGEARPGAKVRMTFINPARQGATVDQVVTITACDPDRKLAWRGRVPLLFEGNHVFDLETEAGGTRLLHGEDMRGLIPLTFSNAMIERDFVPAYEAMNRALAERVASLSEAAGG